MHPSTPALSSRFALPKHSLLTRAFVVNRRPPSRASVGQQRHRQAVVAARAARRRVTAAAPNRSRTPSSAASSASPVAVEREGRAAPRRRRPGCRTATPTSVSPARAGCRGTASASRPRATVEHGVGRRRGPGSVWDRVARVKSSKRSRSMTVRPTRPAARMRRVTRSTRAIDRGVDARAAVAAADRPRARCEPIDPRRRPTCTGRGSRLWARACRWRPECRAEHRRPAPPRGRRATSPTVVMPRSCSLAAVTLPDAPQPLDRQRVEEVPARPRAAPPAARRAWPRRWPPWPGTWCGPRRR